MPPGPTAPTHCRKDPPCSQHSFTCIVTLFDFTQSGSALPSVWRSIDDPVMGGVSESTFVDTDAGAAFTGTVSLERGGGFASVRAPESNYDLSEHDGLYLRLRGDGHHYWVTSYTENGGPISYRTSLQPPTQWTTVSVPFDTLTPYRRGSLLTDAPAFAPSQIRTIGFLIADEQEGTFRLDIQWIRASGMESRS